MIQTDCCTRRKRATVFLFAVFICCSAYAEQFRFKYAEGDSYRILSTVNEDIYFNGRFDHRAEIINRISVSVTSVAGGWAEHNAVFMTSETAANSGTKVFVWGEEYRTSFRRNAQGTYDIGREYYMPVVRNVPVFPEKDLEPGDTWTGEGEEVHDLRRGFGMTEPFRVPFLVSYTYVGPETADGKTLHKIKARYNLYYNSPEPEQPAGDYPATTMGFSDQTLYWNSGTGQLEFYNEEFRIIIETAFGNTLEYRGTAHAEVTELIKNTGGTAVADMQHTLDGLGVENAVVTSDEKGITISLENIQFKADSAVLLDSEKTKLDKLASVLKQYPDNDLLITGHTALAGNAGSRKVLSEQRAQAVAAYLIGLGVKDAYHIFTQGMGAERPIADNRTPAGMARNRRVEITILEQ